MNKFKFDIQKNNLSWEKSAFKQCDSNICNEKGEYRAPKSRIKLNEYFYFCLNHIKEYNKSWDFYKGMTVDQIEGSIGGNLNFSYHTPHLLYDLFPRSQINEKIHPEKN